jgi:hypothetical protein
MAAQIGASIFFNDLNCSQGWSETHYLVSTQSLTAALPLAVTMAEARSMMLGDGILVKYIRVSDANVKGDSQVTPGLPPASKNPIYYNKALSTGDVVEGSGRTLTGISDVPYTALNIRMEMSTTSRKTLYLRGLPDNLDTDGQLLTDATWLKAFNAWTKIMMSGTWGARVLNTDPVANPAKPITGITNVVGPPASITITCPNHGYTVGQSIRISGVKYLPAPAAASTPINGIWQVGSVPDANTFTLSGFSGSVQYFFGGSARARTYNVLAYTNVQQITLCSRRAGRPFGSLRGRRKRYKAYH